MTEGNNDSWQPRIVTMLVIAAAISAASIKVLHNSCSGCAAAAFASPIPAADVVGVIYYSILAAALLRFRLNRVTLFGIYVAAGVHLGLLLKMAEFHLACVPCILCAAFIGGAALWTMSGRERVTSVAVLAGLFTMLVSSSIYHKWMTRQAVANTKTAIGFDHLPLANSGALPVYVFERRGCHVCQEFDDLYIPKLSSIYGKAIALHVRTAPSGIVTPTIVVGGSNPVLWNYEPSWRELSTTIDLSLSLCRNRADSRVEATTPVVTR